MSRLVVALDGPAGSGKSTVAQRVAARIGATLLDTGAIYRSLAFSAREQGVSWDDESSLTELARSMRLRFQLDDGENRCFLGDKDVSSVIRDPEISRGASAVSAWPAVRKVLLPMQRQFAEAGPVVAEGRDMGTVVFPEAQLKIFLSASGTVRARRRTEQLLAAGQDASFDEVLASIEARDQADSERDVAPLKVAAAAREIDTTTLSIDEVVDRIVELCEQAGG